MDSYQEVVVESYLQSIHVLFSSFVLVIIYFCWKSTQVNPQTPGVHQLRHFVRRSSSIVSNVSANESTEEVTSSVENITDSIFAEASETFNHRNARVQQSSEENHSSEEEQIIQEMDRDLPTSSHENTARRRNSPSTSTESQQKEEEISVKLKYLNDEIKIVNGYLNETVGNFKRRHFNAELESKLIKLIFNGQVLEDDKKSLSSCGIFRNAVVHILVLHKRNNSIETPLANPETPRNVPTRSRHLDNGTLYIYIIGMLLVSTTLLISWYFRIQYSSYFSWWSTLGLFLMTSLFLVMIPLLSRLV